jgi:hypothetical protein
MRGRAIGSGRIGGYRPPLGIDNVADRPADLLSRERRRCAAAVASGLTPGRSAVTLIVSFMAPLNPTPLTDPLRRDDSDFVVFCFAKPQDAEAFAKRFGGKRLPENRR